MPRQRSNILWISTIVCVVGCSSQPAAIEDQAVGIRPVRVVVRIDGSPLRGATVRFVPEEYLGDALKVATGTT